MGPELAVIASVASTALGFVGSMQQAGAQKRAAREQEAAAEQSRYLAERNAALQEAETAEEARRTRRGQEQEESLTRMRGLASGIQAGSRSFENYLEAQSAENKRALDWLKYSGASRAELERERGRGAFREGKARAAGTRAQAKQTRIGAFGNLASGMGSSYKTYYDFYG